MGDRVIVGEQAAMGGQLVEEGRGRRPDDLLEGVVLLDDHQQVGGRPAGPLRAAAGGGRLAAASGGKHRQQRQEHHQRKRPVGTHRRSSSTRLWTSLTESADTPRCEKDRARPVPDHRD
jgi:hypothetical protein